MATLRNLFTWGTLTYAAIYTAVAAGVYLCHPAEYNPLFRAKYLEMLPVVLTHGFCGILALALGPFQLLGQPGRAHRAAGRVYAGCVLAGALTGVVMSLRAYGGGLSQSGFLLFSLLWLYTLVRAVGAARAGRMGEHRRWMVRNYSLTLGAVLLRAYLNAFVMLGLEYATVYPLVTWLAWLPTLGLAELMERSRTWSSVSNAESRWSPADSVPTAVAS